MPQKPQQDLDSLYEKYQSEQQVSSLYSQYEAEKSGAVEPPGESRSILERVNIFTPEVGAKVGGQIMGAPSATVDAVRGAGELVALQRQQQEALSGTEQTLQGLEAAGPLGLAMGIGRDPDKLRRGALLLKDIVSGAAADFWQTGTDPAKAFEERGLFALFDVADLLAVGTGVGLGAVVARRGLRRGGIEVAEEVAGRGVQKLLPPAREFQGPRVGVAGAQGPISNLDEVREAQTRLAAIENEIEQARFPVSEATPNAVARERIDMGLRGSLPGPRDIDTRIGTAESRLKAADRLERERVAAAYEVATAGRVPDEVGFLMRDPEAELIARGALTNNTPIGNLKGASRAAARREVGQRALSYPTRKRSGVDLGTGKPKGDVLKDALTPTPETPAGDIGIYSSFVRDFDKAVPEVADRVRPMLETMHEEVRVLSEKYGQLTRGIRPGDRFDREIARLLNGEFGDMDNLARLSPTALPVSKRSLDIAMEARRDLDELWVGLKEGPVPDLAYNKNYITFLRDEYTVNNLMPPDLVRYSGRKNSFQFLARNDGTVPDDLSFIESMSVYAPAALRKIHMDPAFKIMDEARAAFEAAGQGNKFELTNLMQDVLMGKSSPAERIVDRGLINAGNRLGINVQARPTMRAAMSVATGFYRGILGGNISASVNNMTQSVNTIAKAGLMPTLAGMAKMTTRSGRQVAREANLSRDFRRLFEENRRFGSKMRKFDDVIFAPFNFAETMNRGIAFHAGASKARRMGASVDEAAVAGRKMAQQTQFVYDELARNPHFRSPLGRMAGVLTSFPIKQGEFLAELARNDKTGLVRYLAATGLAAWVTEEQLGVQVGAFRRVPLPGGMKAPPGFEFLQTIEGADLGFSPPGQLLQGGLEALDAYAEGDPRSAHIATSRFLDGLTDMVVPASVQIKEGLRTAREVSTGKVQRPLGKVPFAKELGPMDDATGFTTPTASILTALGFKPTEKVREREAERAIVEFTRRRRGGISRANDIAGFFLREGDREGVTETLKEAGGSADSFRRSVRSGQLPRLLRLVQGMSNAETREFMQQHPEMADIIAKQRAAMLSRR